MTDEFDRISRGTAQAGLGLVTKNPIRVVEGVATVFGLETNASVMQKHVALAHEDFVFETLLQLKADGAAHKSRLDTYEQRLLTVSWIVEEHQRRLGEWGAIPSDLAALVDASSKVWKRNADARKRKLLRNALLNAFDPKQYAEGLTLRLLGILEDLEYGDVWVLRTMREQFDKWPRDKNGTLLVTADDLKSAREHGDTVVPIRIDDVRQGSLIDDHIKRLDGHRLVYPQHKGWLLNGKSENSALKVPLPSAMGERLLALLAEPEADKAP